MKNTDIYEQVSRLRLSVGGVRIRKNSLNREEKRTTREFCIEGDGHTGYGEDVTTSVNEALFDRIHAHESSRAAGQSRFSKDGYAAEEDVIDIPAGDYTLDGFYEKLDRNRLWDEPPGSESFARYRRWAVESAALDLALKQADETLASAFGRDYEPVEFVKSLRLGHDSVEDVRNWLRLNPDIGFKIDVTPNLSQGTFEELSETANVRVLDMKGQYGHHGVGAPVDTELYRTLFETFPEAILEDPVVTDETEEVLRRHSDRISWDAPVTGAEALDGLPWEPRILNVKPCRFGTVESFFDFLECAADNGIKLYGGGMIELGVGRKHLQAVASLFYPNAPNDLAPTEYHVYEPGKTVPESPIHPPDSPAGLGW